MKTTAEKIEVMRAYEEGKEIECKSQCESDDTWGIVRTPHWDWFNNDYRVKEEQKYRPYKDTEELINDFCERSGAKRSTMGEPFIWVETSGIKRLIVTYSYDAVYIQFNSKLIDICMSELFESYTFKDGSPCGKKVE